MLSIVRDHLCEEDNASITLYLSERISEQDRLGPLEKSQISSYILRKYPNANFAQVCLQYSTDTTVIPIHTLPIEHNSQRLSLARVQELLDATLNWEPRPQTLTIKRKEHLAQLTVDQAYLWLNGKQLPLERPVRLTFDALRIPLRLISCILDVQHVPDAADFVWMLL